MGKHDDQLLCQAYRLPYGENLYQIKRGNNGISRDVAERIVAKFPEISKAWILTGEGSMFASESSSASQIPFYNATFETGREISIDEAFTSLFIPQLGSCDLQWYTTGRPWAVRHRRERS